MGPAASANIYSQIIEYAQHKYGAVQDEDFPPIIINSLTLKGFDETGIKDDKLVLKQLIKGVQTLEKAGCDIIIIGCNTVHTFFDEMQSSVQIPILNIVEETKNKLLTEKITKVGLLASESTYASKLYQAKFEDSKIPVITANSSQKKEISKVIERVMAGTQNNKDIIILKNIIADFVKQGVDGIVLGCTELPLAINQTNTDIKLFDAVETIVEKAVDSP